MEEFDTTTIHWVSKYDEKASVTGAIPILACGATGGYANCDPEVVTCKKCKTKAKAAEKKRLKAVSLKTKEETEKFEDSING